MRISVSQAAAFLKEQDKFLILSHHNPDGDTIGSAFALCRALRLLRKEARVACSDPLPPKYGYITGGYAPAEFEPSCVVAVDVADPKLLGEPLMSLWADKVDLCIDHHASNVMFAGRTLLDTSAGANTMIIYHILRELGIDGDPAFADAIFTGLTTDTGCFQYTNVTPECHRIAALMIEWGADHGRINKLMFGTKSKKKLAAEREILDTLEYHFEDRCAVVTIPLGLRTRYHLERGELEGIASIPREIEDVEAGVTLRQLEEDVIKVSLRCSEKVNASQVCVRLGGGGHAAAAGCTLTGNLEDVKKRILAEIKSALDQTAGPAENSAG